MTSKAQFKYHINCPSGKHVDNKPSCAIYSDGSGYCFSCNTYFKDLEPADKKVERYVEDLPGKLKYIKSLPTADIRGLKLPADSDGFYIVWPSDNYYKLRRWDDNHPNGRYLSPSGIPKPWFCAHTGTSKTLVLIEGEINALSVALLQLNMTIVSPGSASNFADNTARYYYSRLLGYDRVYLIVDEDGPGFEAAVKAKTLVKEKIPNTKIILMGEDANSILMRDGKEGLQKELKKLGM